jgi:hypothetical protein
MASRASLIQSRSIYVGTLNSVAPSDGNLIVTGNVGIGTTSPAAKLQVENAGDVLNLKLTTGGYNTLTLSTVNFSGGNNYAINPYITGVSNGGFEIKDLTNNASRIAIAPTSGNVGIGTTSPSYKLDVESSSGLIETIRVRNGYTGGSDGAQPDTEKMRITSAGNVGIGTTAPSSILHVDGVDPYVRINNVNSGNNQGIKISYNYSDTHGFHLSYNPNAAGAYIDNTYPITSGQAWGDIYFRQNNGTGTMLTRMTIKADGGNVGIGTASPTAELQVHRRSHLQQ